MAKKGVKRALEIAPVLVTCTAIFVKPSEVPEYLRCGSFYSALDIDDDEPFPVPSDAMKLDQTLLNSEDLVHLLQSLRFWGIEGFHPGIVDFVLNSGAKKIKSSIAKFEQNYPYLFTLHEILNNPERDEVLVAIDVGDLDMLKYLYEKKHASKFADPIENMRFAITRCQVACLEYLFTKQVQTPSAELLVRAAVWCESLDCLKCVEQHTSDFATYMSICDWPTICTANLKMFLHCYRLNQSLGIRVVVDALFCGGVETARQCVEAGVSLDPLFTICAVKRNRPDILRYLLEAGCELHPLCCLAAAFVGNLQLLRFSHEHGCAMTSETILTAVKCNHLNCLQFAHENGCPWPSNAYNYTSSKKSVYKYLVKHGCPRFEQQDDTL